jgi:hypothetical protein
VSQDDALAGFVRALVPLTSGKQGLGAQLASAEDFIAAVREWRNLDAVARLDGGLAAKLGVRGGVEADLFYGLTVLPAFALIWLLRHERITATVSDAERLIRELWSFRKRRKVAPVRGRGRRAVAVAPWSTATKMQARDLLAAVEAFYSRLGMTPVVARATFLDIVRKGWPSSTSGDRRRRAARSWLLAGFVANLMALGRSTKDAEEEAAAAFGVSVSSVQKARARAIR